MKRKKIIFILGPTGVGKTEVGIKLPEFLPCEFISADSMQVYKGMDIVTDKLPLKLRRRYPHHLVSAIPLSKDYNAAQFCKMAKKAVRAIIKKKKTPVVIGGTGMYIDSFIYGIGRAPAKDETVRARLRDEAGQKGEDYLYEKLKSLDPKAAQKINRGDQRRLIRALEVYELTGRPLSALQERENGLIDEYDARIFGLRRDKTELYRRIDQRVDFMMNAGLLDEIRRVLKKRISKTAHCCIGVREVEGFLKGDYDLPEAIRLIKRNSRHFAKRQMTWFNKNKGIEWIELREGFGAFEAARLIFEHTEKNEFQGSEDRVR